MCRQATVLVMLKAQRGKGGLSAGQIKLTEAQIADYKEQNERHQQDMSKMEDRMTNLEKKFDVLDKKVDAVDGKIDRVLQALATERTFITALKSVLNNKVFLYLLITILCAAFGVSVGEVGTFLFR